MNSFPCSHVASLSLV
ncbi:MULTISPECIES: hypothetical protein [Serratia]